MKIPTLYRRILLSYGKLRNLNRDHYHFEPGTRFRSKATNAQKNGSVQESQLMHYLPSFLPIPLSTPLLSGICEQKDASKILSHVILR